MRCKRTLLSLLLGLPCIGYAQVGINTDNPKAALHIEPSSKDTPTGTDGILIPKVKVLPTTSTMKGVLVFLQNHATLPDNFYFWEGTKWIPFIRSVSKELDETVYSFNGKGMTDGYFNFSQFNKKSEDNFAIQSGNSVKVGKKGTYQVQLSSSIRRNGPQVQSNFDYNVEIYRGSEKTEYKGLIGYPIENVTGSSINMGFIVDLKEGDIIKVKGVGSKPTSDTYTYTTFGTTNLTLTFIEDTEE